jgi:hypothetical protein
MDLDLLLKLKLKNELIHEINQHFDDMMDIDLKQLITDKVSVAIQNQVVTIDNQPSESPHKDTQCCARIWKPQYSDVRCPWLAQDSDYCGKHSLRIKEYGYLAFGRFDSPRPIINEKGNKIPWRDTTPMNDIETIIQYQHLQLKKLMR